LDSLNKKVLEALRVNAKLERAIGAIDLLNDEKIRTGRETPRINLTPTFFRQNIRELPLFIDFALDRNIHVVQASPGQVYRPSWVPESLLHFPELTRRMAIQTEKKADQLGVTFINKLRMVYVNRGNKLLRFLRGKETLDFPTDPSSCLKPWTSIFIEPDGEVRPCCYLSPVLGSIYEKDFPEIWNGNAARKLRSDMVSQDLPRQCRDCYEFNRHKPEIMVSLE
jgi:radical SAM protein with 4Fe4S-binding SPASM domain